MKLNLFLTGLLTAALVACGHDDVEPVAGPVNQSVPAENPDSARGAITADSLLANIETLASDEFGGRAPMSEGERLTLDFLEQAFRDEGLQPMFGDSYRQPVPLVSIEADPDVALEITGPGEQRHAWAYGPEVMLWTTRVVEESGLDASELVWVGYGIVAPEYGWDDYAGLDVAGKTVVMLVNDPGFVTGDPQRFNGRSMTYYGRWTYKYEEAARQGAAGALIIHQTAPAAYGWNVVEDSNKGPQFHLVTEDGNAGRVAVEGWLQWPVAQAVFASAGLELETLAAEASRAPVTPRPLGLTASVTLHNTLAYAESFNVGAVLPGAERPEEMFIYMAHWDHLGMAHHGDDEQGDFIYNGAEDNASGTAGLLEISRAFSRLETPPARSVGFLAVTAEESGLLGSQAYAASPAWPMNRTVGGINMDRLNVRGKVRDISVVGFGASEMEDRLAVAAGAQGRTLTPEGTPEKGYYYRSDHFNFAKRGVPILYARGGTVSRDQGPDYIRERDAEFVAERYHSPADEVQQDWDLDAAVEDLQLFFDIGLDLANSDDWPQWYEGNEFRAIREASLSETE